MTNMFKLGSKVRAQRPILLIICVQLFSKLRQTEFDKKLNFTMTGTKFVTKQYISKSLVNLKLKVIFARPNVCRRLVKLTPVANIINFLRP